MSWSGDLNESEEIEEISVNNEQVNTSDIVEKANYTMSCLRYYAFSRGLDMLTSPKATNNLIYLIMASKNTTDF